MTFSTSLDTQAKLVTIGLVTLLFSALMLPMVNLKLPPYPFWYFFISIYLLPIIIFSYYFLLMPLDYSISHQNITIRRRIRSIVLTKDNIIEVTFLDSDLLKNQSYISGVIGLFGYTGKTYLNGTGILRWYGTRKDKTICISTKDRRRIIITPDEPVAFIQSFSKFK